jgi:hypothetical protein
MNELDELRLFVAKRRSRKVDRELVNEVTMDIYDGNYNLFFDEIERNRAMGFTVFRSVGDAFYDGGILILDNETNEFISWYKLAHIGRDLHTNIITEEQLRRFIQKFYDCNKEES